MNYRPGALVIHCPVVQPISAAGTGHTRGTGQYQEYCQPAQISRFLKKPAHAGQPWVKGNLICTPRGLSRFKFSPVVGTLGACESTQLSTVSLIASPVQHRSMSAVISRAVARFVFYVLRAVLGVRGGGNSVATSSPSALWPLRTLLIVMSPVAHRTSVRTSARCLVRQRHLFPKAQYVVPRPYYDHNILCGQE